jgi:predicted dehydrogenase
VTIEFENGRLGYHFGTWGARGTRLRYAIHAHCTEGLLEADISSHKLVHILRGEETVLLESASGKHTENEMAHFLDCIATGQTPLTNGRGSLQGLRVIWRLYEAEQEQRMANLMGLGLDEV